MNQYQMRVFTISGWEQIVWIFCSESQNNLKTETRCSLSGLGSRVQRSQGCKSKHQHEHKYLCYWQGSCVQTDINFKTRNLFVLLKHADFIAVIGTCLFQY